MNFSTADELVLNSNDTCENVQLTGLFVALYTCMIAVIFLTICGNLLVVISISHFKQLHTPTNVLILSLAAADMMVGITVLPIYFTSNHFCMRMDRAFCYFYLLCSYHFTFLSIYTVSFISLDRLYFLRNPFQYSNKVTFKLIFTVNGLNWLTSFGYNLTFIYINGTSTGNVLYFEDCNVVPNGLWASIDLFLVFILPCSVILLSYMKIFLIARKHSKGIKLAKGNTTTRNRKYVPKASERKAATTLGILVIVFLACLLPYFLSILFSAFIPDTLMKVLAGTLPLLYLNSAINPIIYALFYPWFRKCAKLIFMLSIFNTDSSLVNVLTNSG